MNGKDILLGLKYVGDDLIEKAEYGQFSTRAEKTEKKGNSRRSIRRPLLIAALIATMLLLVGCAVVYVLRMQDVKIGEATETRDYRLVDGTYVEDPHEVNQNVLTLAGLKGTKAYQACADFFAFKEEYTQNMEAMMNNGTLPEDFFENDTYGKAMNAKASELAAQYGLKPEGESLNFRTTRNMCDALGIERFVKESEEISTGVAGGSCYNTGNFYLYFDFDFPEERNYEVLHTSGYLRWNRTDCFSQDYVALVDTGDWVERNYTTASGSNPAFPECSRDRRSNPEAVHNRRSPRSAKGFCPCHNCSQMPAIPVLPGIPENPHSRSGITHPVQKAAPPATKGQKTPYAPD